MKKFIVIFISLIFVIFVANCVLIWQEKKESENRIMTIELEKITNKDNTFEYVHKDCETFNFRKHSVIHSSVLHSMTKEKHTPLSIIISGCSFVFGYQLMYKDTFGEVLASYLTNVSRCGVGEGIVYNWGIDGGSPRELLYIMRNKDMINDILYPKPKSNIKYIIYVFIPDQLPRLYSNVYRFSPTFKVHKENNWKSLVYYKRNEFIWNLLIYKKLRTFYAYKFVPKDKAIDLLLLYMKEINKEIISYFGKDTKFVLLLYNTDDVEYKKLFQLQNEGIIVINTDSLVNIDLEDSKYTIEDRFHPNKKAWEIIGPALIKKLNTY